MSHIHTHKLFSSFVCMVIYIFYFYYCIRSEKLSVIDVSAMTGRGAGRKNGLSYRVSSLDQLISRTTEDSYYMIPTCNKFDGAEYGDEVLAPDVGMQDRYIKKLPDFISFFPSFNSLYCIF